MDLILSILLNCLCFIFGVLAKRIYLYIIKYLRKKVKDDHDENEDEDEAKPDENKKTEEEDYNFENSDLKMVFLVREDLKLGAGKIAAQVAHAAIGLCDDITNGEDSYRQQAFDHWEANEAKKDVFRVENLEALKSANMQCKKLKIPSVMISDAGHTQVDPGTVTVVGIGPEESEKLNEITRKLKLL